MTKQTTLQPLELERTNVDFCLGLAPQKINIYIYIYIYVNVYLGVSS